MIIKINGKKINYHVFGHGQPIVFVHGWGGSIRSLEDLALLSSDKYQAIILDLPGFGKSDIPEPSWGVGEYAEIIVKLIKSLRLNDVVYFGHSFGGSLGIYISVNYPNLIKKLILCNSSYQRLGKKTIIYETFKKIVQIFPSVKKQAERFKKILYGIFFRGSDLLKYPLLEKNFKKIMEQNLSPLLTKINAPTLILWGENDQVTPLASGIKLKQSIKQSRFKSYPNVGHNLPTKYPDLMFKEINRFI